MSVNEKGDMKIVSVKLKIPSASVSGRSRLAIPRQGLPRDEKFDVVVAEITNPGHFYLQLGKFIYSSVKISCLLFITKKCV